MDKICPIMSQSTVKGLGDTHITIPCQKEKCALWVDIPVVNVSDGKVVGHNGQCGLIKP